VSAVKKLAGMVTNPRGDWTLDEFTSVANHYHMQRAQSGGSHFMFYWEGKDADPITVAVCGGRTAKTVVTRHFLSYLLGHSPEALEDCRSQLKHDRKALAQLDRIMSSIEKTGR
jgi:hypothetical protein